MFLLVSAPLRAQDTPAPPATEIAPGTVRAGPEGASPQAGPPPDATPLPADPLRPAAGAETRPVFDPPVSEPPSAPVPPTAVEPARSVAPAAPGLADQPRRSDWFIHADVGAGYLRTTGSRGGSNFTTQGGALVVALALGWAPSDEWAIGLEGLGWKSLAATGLGPSTSVELQALGVSVTRSFVPADVFATVVVSGTRLAITDSGDYAEHASSDIGFGFKALAGKEWRVGPAVGLGVAGELVLSVNREGGQTLRTLGAGLVLSCTTR